MNGLSFISASFNYVFNYVLKIQKLRSLKFFRLSVKFITNLLSLGHNYLIHILVGYWINTVQRCLGAPST